MKIALVFRSGGDYNASDVQWLVNQLPKGYEIICLTDLKRLHVPGVKVVPLINQWQKCRGWWAKIELFRPDITDDLFYLDLDTVIAGDIRPILEHPPTSFTMLRDFYHPQYRGSGALWIPNSVKAHIWSSFWQDPEGWISRCVTTECWGDQGFLRKVMGDDTPAFQDLYPRMVCKLQGRCCGTRFKICERALLRGEWGITKRLPNNLFPRQTATSRSVRGLASPYQLIF